MIESIKSSFTFPLGQQKLKEGRDYSIVVKVGGGRKIVKVTFKNTDHRTRMEKEMNSIAKTEGVELTLDIAA